MKRAESGSVGRAPVKLRVFKDPEANWILLRTVSFMNEKAAELGECLDAAHRIQEREIESWINTWAETAETLLLHAGESERAGHALSAGESLLRASNYFRTAEYGAYPGHPRFHDLWRKSVSSFRRAAVLLRLPLRILLVPFEGKLLPGYFLGRGGEPRPTVVGVGGNDSSLEELFFWCGFAAFRRGYNFFAFDHPGHRGALHTDAVLSWRPHVETAYSAALDLLMDLPGTDDRIALVGYSAGGYVVNRVAAHEARVRAIVPDSPIVDQHRLVMDAGGGIAYRIPDRILRVLVEMKLKRSPLRRSLSLYGRWTRGIEGQPIREQLEWTRKFILTDDELASIRCPALGLLGAEEGEPLRKQAELWLEKIGSADKSLHIFDRGRDMSADHCQLDNRSRGNQVTFDWLDRVFCTQPVIE